MSSPDIQPYRKDPQIENLLKQVNTTLAPLEQRLTEHFAEPRWPILFVSGTQRSGTTLLYQLLTTCFHVGYPSNLMARYWEAPYIGALLSQELRSKQPPPNPNFQSEFGNTYGPFGPHEFGYFWQRWIPYAEGDVHELDEVQAEKIDVGGFRRVLAALEAAFNQPLVFKNPLLSSLNMTLVAELLPTAMFIICEREPVYIAQSTYKARMRFMGDTSQWWSIRPAAYRWLKDLPAPEQIAGQIYYTEQCIARGRQTVDKSRHLTIRYEALCADPAGQLSRVAELVANAGYALQRTAYEPEPFPCANIQTLDDGTFQALLRACQRMYQL